MASEEEVDECKNTKIEKLESFEALTILLFEIFEECALERLINFDAEYSLSESFFSHTNIFGRNLLHIAAKNGSLKFIEYTFPKLSEECLKQALNLADHQKDTPLALACAFGYPRRTNVRVKLAKINAKRLKIVQLFIDNGADVARSVKAESHNPLHWAVFYGDEAVGRLLYDTYPVMLDCLNQDRLGALELPLCEAILPEAREGSCVLLRYICNETFKQYFETTKPLQAMEGKPLGRGRPRRLIHGVVPMQSRVAVSMRMLDIIERPKEAKLPKATSAETDLIVPSTVAIMREDDKKFWRNSNVQLLQKMLGICVYCQENELVRMLIGRFKLNPFARCFNGLTPLHVAVSTNNREALSYFCTAKFAYAKGPSPFELYASINATTDEGDTALHLACKTRNEAVIAFLLERGASPRLFNYLIRAPAEMMRGKSPALEAACAPASAGNSLEEVATLSVWELLCAEQRFAFILTASAVNGETSNCLVYQQLQNIPGVEVDLVEPLAAEGAKSSALTLLVGADESFYNRRAEGARFKLFDFQRRQSIVFAAPLAQNYECFRDFHRYELLLHAINEEFNLETFKKTGVVDLCLLSQAERRKRDIMRLWLKTITQTLLYTFTRARDGSSLQPFSAVAFYFGCPDALYISFMCLFISYLALLSLWAVAPTICTIYFRSFDTIFLPVYCILLNVILGFYFQSWKALERIYVYAWRTDTAAENEIPRIEYRGYYRFDLATRAIVKQDWHSSFTRRWLLTAPLICLGVFFVVSSFILFNYLNELVAQQGMVTNGLVGVSNSVANFITESAYNWLCTRLLEHENHKFDSSLRNAYAVRICIFKFANTFINLFYYILFKQDFKLFATNYLTMLVTSDCIYLAKKHVLRTLLYKFKERKLFRGFERHRALKLQAAAGEAEARPDAGRLQAQLAVSLQTARVQIMPDAYNALAAWIHTFTQYCFVCMFSPACPVAVLWVFVFNLAETTLTFHSLSDYVRRSTCLEAASIGAWNSLFVAVSHLSIFIHALILLLPSHSMYYLLNLDADNSRDQLIALGAVAAGCAVLIVFKVAVLVVVPTVPGWMREKMRQESGAGGGAEVV